MTLTTYMHTLDPASIEKSTFSKRLLFPYAYDRSLKLATVAHRYWLDVVGVWWLVDDEDNKELNFLASWVNRHRLGLMAWDANDDNIINNSQQCLEYISIFILIISYTPAFRLIIFLMVRLKIKDTHLLLFTLFIAAIIQSSTTFN